MQSSLSLAGPVIFRNLPRYFWDSCTGLFTSETMCSSEEGDLCYLVDGILFLVKDPAGIANLVIQRIAPSVHPIFPTKHIYELCIILYNLGYEYLTFNGYESRYETLYKRLFHSLLQDRTPHILRYDADIPNHTSYVLHLTPFVIEYFLEQTKHITYKLV